jgi:WW domain-containing oxidoreductase
MAKSHLFGARSTADQVLAGIDLTGKRFVVTGCGSGIGFETMCALSANGADVMGLARTLRDAEIACGKAGPSAIPVACDLADLDSVAAAAGAIRGFQAALDGIIANAGIAHLPTLQTRYGVEMQFLVNHIGHFSLVTQIQDLVRDRTGRIVIVSSSAAIDQAPAEGILFDNLDGRRFYDPTLFYGQSKLANALFAVELARRLGHRGIAVNAAHPGNARRTGLGRNARLAEKIARWGAHWFLKSAQQAAATQALLAANPGVGAISGEFWSNCRIAAGNPIIKDPAIATRLWEVSEEILTQQTERAAKPALQQAA